MAKSFLILLNILLAANVILAFYYQESKYEFQYLGRMIRNDYKNNFYYNYKNAFERTPYSPTADDFYISMNSADYPTSQRSCKEYLGPRAELVAIDSDVKWNFLKVELEKIAGGSRFWTSGIYDTTTEEYRWYTTDEIITPIVKWAVGQPTKNPTALHRISILHQNRHISSMYSSPNSDVYRYLCEIPVEDKVEPCYEKSEIAIVLDASSSVGEQNFYVAKDFVYRFAELFSDSEISFVTYSARASTIFDFKSSISQFEMRHRIRTAPLMRGSTDTAAGIRTASELFNYYERDIPRVMILITDGMSNDRKSTLAAASNIRSMGVYTYVVGVTDKVDREELLQIAGGDQTNVFTTNDFNGLTPLLDSIAKKVCRK